SAIIMVLTDSRLREALCQRSLGRAKFFSWEKTARETLAVFDALLAKPVTPKKKVLVFLKGLFYNPRLDWYKINFNLFPIRGKILDVGCARGPFIELAPARIVGLDWNRHGLKECVNKAYKVINGDALKLPFRDQSFEGIHCADLIEHFPPHDARRLLIEMLRTLKVGGFLVIATPLLSKAFWEDAFHVRPYPPYSLLSYCVGNAEQGIGIQTNHGLLLHNMKFVKLIWRYTSFYQLPLHIYFREDRMKLSNLMRPSSLLFMLSNLLYRIGLKDPRPEGYVLLLQKV
ncbi:MAG: methyltransferase domain-containing protein, partial [Candidatus Omnitrophica bacterium]|nr:methyltransferase domain-containing protein [Candidatus Omnitrophota bacterium]